MANVSRPQTIERPDPGGWAARLARLLLRRGRLPPRMRKRLRELGSHSRPAKPDQVVE